MKEFHHEYLKHELRTKPIFWGIFSSLILIFIYAAILTIANSFSHAIQQFFGIWYFMLPLIIGFGIQVGLFAYIRAASKVRENMVSGSAIAGTGSISATSMVACCAHHITEVLPLVGFSAATLFMGKYQALFLIVGIISNIFGLNIMLRMIQKHRLYLKGGFLSKFLKVDMKKRSLF